MTLIPNAARDDPNWELELKRAELIDAARTGLLAFICYTFPEYAVNWHHRELARVLNKFARGEIKRLIVTMPPRHGKSQQVSRHLPAFMLGQNPRLKVVAASYAAELADAMNRDVQRIIDSKEYRDVFPETKLRGGAMSTTGGANAWVRNSGLFETVGYGGTYRSVGVGGSLTGLGGDRILVDDPIKNQEEADSLAQRNKVWDWYTSTLHTRCEPGGGICVTATRWHDDDLIGRLLKLSAEDPNADQWTVVNIPAVAESEPHDHDPRAPDEVLWPERYPSTVLAAIKATLGSRKWSALYQQRPAPELGLLIQRTWWRYFDVYPERFDQIVQAWDLTFTKSETSDYVAGGTFGRKGADIYLLDLVHDRLSFTQSLVRLKALRARWPQCQLTLVEKAANGAALHDTLQSEVPGIVLVPPKGSKVARVNAVSPRIEAGNVWIPSSEIAPGWGGPDGTVVTEWTAFPSGVHDDIVDMMTYAILRFMEEGPTDFLPISLTQVNRFADRPNNGL